MKLSLWLAGILLTLACVLMFALVLDAEPFQDQTLAVLNTLLAYPVVAYGAFSFYQVFRANVKLRRRRVNFICDVALLPRCCMILFVENSVHQYTHRKYTIILTTYTSFGADF